MREILLKQLRNQKDILEESNKVYKKQADLLINTLTTLEKNIADNIKDVFSEQPVKIYDSEKGFYFIFDVFGLSMTEEEITAIEKATETIMRNGRFYFKNE